MSNTALKIAIALSIVLTPPAASFARGGHGGGHGGFARTPGSAGTGNVPISGIPRGPGNFGGFNNVTVDPSGHNVSRIVSPPLPHIAVPTPPGGMRSPAALPSMNVAQQPLPEALGGGGVAGPRAEQMSSEQSPTNPNGPLNREFNRENAAVDRMVNICRGC
jgi:hypothetical protein